MEIRQYTSEDKLIMKEIFQIHTPKFFDPGEWNDYEIYLDRNESHYFVVEVDGKVVGGGGYRITKGGRVGRVSWDIVRPEYIGQGAGHKLVLNAIDQIKEKHDPEIIEVWTSNKSFRFYEKFGFKTLEFKRDYWGKGLDLYRMELSE